MKTFQSSISVLAALLLCACASQLTGEDEYRQTVFLKYNLRYDMNRKTASCVNHQNGALVPAGSKITILGHDEKLITLQTEDGTTIRLQYRSNYTGMQPDKWIQQVTALSDPSGEWKNFTELERKGIRTGKALIGMRKKAVIVALGYPPAHKTPSLELDRWTYWSNRFVTFGVRFAGDKVIEVGGAGR
jgi:hypothetical protein